MTGESTNWTGAYLLGHSENEIDRLVAQARLVDPITERFLRQAGVRPGMRVLDVGTGAGDVAFLAATLVSEGGEVVGVDNAVAAIDAAKRRAGELTAPGPLRSWLRTRPASQPAGPHLLRTKHG